MDQLLGLLAEYGIDPAKVLSVAAIVMTVVQLVKSLVPNWTWLVGTNVRLVTLGFCIIFGGLKFYSLGWLPAVIGIVAVAAVSLGGYELIKSARTQVGPDGKPIT